MPEPISSMIFPSRDVISKLCLPVLDITKALIFLCSLKEKFFIYSILDGNCKIRPIIFSFSKIKFPPIVNETAGNKSLNLNPLFAFQL